MDMDDQDGRKVASKLQAANPGMKPLLAWFIVSALVLGFFIGRVASDGPAVSAAANEPDATATRTAELAELDALRTQVAQQPSACPQTPTPAATPTPVPAGDMGQPYPYTDAWTVVVKDAEPVLSSGDVQPKGAFLKVNLTITNNRSEHELFPFTDLQLVDGQNRTFLVSQEGSNAIIATNWDFFIDPSIPVDKSVVFDVATDSGTSFILQSTTEPTFRVKVEVVQRG
jgi:hypothetical protein